MYMCKSPLGVGYPQVLSSVVGIFMFAWKSNNIFIILHGVIC